MIPFEDVEQIPYELTPADRKRAAEARAWLEQRRRELNEREATTGAKRAA